ncbi:MAG: hypothetical protein AAFY21_10775 [Cyanobacteria bacterium J06641_2]
MPRNVQTISFRTGTATAYIADFAASLTVSRKVNVPPDISDTEMANIATIVGGEILPDDIACPDDNNGGDPRYLNFIRASGNSVSVPFRLRDDLITVATNIKAILDSKVGNEVICINLVGEEYRNLNDIFSLNYDGTTFAKSHKADATAGKQFYYSGTIAYNADAATTVGAGTTARIRSITDVENDSATQLGTAFDSCAGTFLSGIRCPAGRRNPRAHRRYHLYLATKIDPAEATEDPQPEQIQVPVAAFSSTDIQNCGDALAALDGVYCIGYKGEDYRDVHKLI